MLGSNSNPPVFRSVSSNRRFVPVEQPQGCLSPLLTGVSPLGVVRESYNSNSIGTNVEVATTTNSGNNMNNATTNSNTTGNNTNSNVVPQVSVSISNTNKFNFTGLANKPRLRVQSPSPIWTNNNTRGILHGGIANIGVNNQGGGSSSSSSSTEGGTSSNADGSTGNNGEQTTQQRTNTSVPFSANSSSSSLTTAGGLTSMSGTVDNNNVNSNNAYTTPSNQQNASLPAPVSVGSTTTSFRQTNSTTTGNAGNTRSYQVTSPLAGPRFPNLPPPKLLGGAPGGSRARSPLVNFHSASNNTNNANSLLGGHSVVVGAGNSGNKNESTGNQSITTNPSPLAHGSFAPSQNTTRTVGHTTPSQHMSIPTAARSPPASCPWSSSGQQSAFGTINRGPSPMDRSKVATSQQKNDNTQQQTANTSATPLVRAPTPTCFNLLGGNNGSKQQQGQSTMSEGIQRSTLSCNFRTKDPNSTFLRGPSPPKSGPMGFVPYAGVLNAGPSPTQFARGLLGGHSGSKVPNSHLSSYNSGTNSITPCMISGGAGKSSSSSSSAAATTSSSMEFTKDPRRTNLVYGVANGKKKSSSDVSSNQVPPDTKTEPSVNIGGGQTHVQKSLMSRRGNYNYYGNGKPLDNVAEATAIEESNSRELSQPQRPLLRTSKSRSLSSSPQIQGNNTATSSTTAVPNENANKADTASKHGANSSNNNFLTSNTGVASGNLATNNRASDRLLQSTASQKTELQQGDDLLGSVCTNPHNHFSSTGGILSDRFLMTEDIEKTTGTNFGIADEHYANGLNAALAMEQANGILVPVDDDDQIQIGLDVADPRSGSINDNTIDSSSLNSTSLLKVSTEQTIDIVVTPIDHTTGSIEENTIYSMKSFSLDELQEMQERMDRDAAGALLQSARNSARNSARSSLAARNSNGNVNTKGGTTLNIVDAAGKHVKPGSSTTATATTTQKSLSKLASRSSGSNNSVTRKGSSSSSGPQGDLRTLRKDSNDLNAEESPLDINFVDDQTPAGGVNNIFSTEKSRVSTTSSNGRSNGSPLDTNGNSDTAASALAAASSSNSLPIHDKYSVAWGMVDNEADVAIKDVAEGAVKEAESNVKKIQKASSARPSGGEIGDFRIYEDAEDGNPGETNESVVDTASKIILQEVDTNINNLLPQARASHPKDSKRFRFVSDHSSNAFSSNASPVTRVGDSFQESENLENFAPYANTKGLAVKRAKSEMDMIYRHGTGKTSTNEKSHGTMMIHEGPNSLPPAIATSNSGPREVTAVAAEPIRVQKKDSNVSNTSHASTPTSCMSSGSSSCAARSPLELVDMQVVHVPNRAVQTTNPYLSKGNSGSSSAAPPSGGEEIVENKGIAIAIEKYRNLIHY